MFGFVAKHLRVWPVGWMRDPLGVSPSGFHAWLARPRSHRSLSDERIGGSVRTSFLRSDRAYGARRVWHDVLAEGVDCGPDAIERLMHLQGPRARPRRRRFPKDAGDGAIIAPNVLDRTFDADGPTEKWVADFTYVWTVEGRLCVAVVLDLFSRRAVGWSMKDAMPSQLVTDALIPPGTLLRNALSGSGWRSGGGVVRRSCFTTPTGAANTPAKRSSVSWPTTA